MKKLFRGLRWVLGTAIRLSVSLPIVAIAIVCFVIDLLFSWPEKTARCPITDRFIDCTYVFGRCLKKYFP